MARLRLSKWSISLFIMANMIWRMFDPARLSFRVTSCKRSVAPKSSTRDHILQLEWVQITDLAQGDDVTPTLKSASSVGRFAVSECRRALDRLGSVAGLPLCVGHSSTR